MSEPTIHERTQELLSAAHDDPRSVSSSDLKKARAHLTRCPQCRAFDAALQEGGPAIGQPGEGERASSALVARVLAAVEAQRAAGPVAEAEQQAEPAETLAAPQPEVAVVPAQTAPETFQETEPAPQEPAEGPEPALQSAGGPATHRRSHTRRSPMPAWSRWAWAGAAAAAVLALFLGVRLAVGPAGLPMGGSSAPTAGTTAGGTAAELSAPQAASPGAVTGGGASKNTSSAHGGYSPGYTAPRPSDSSLGGSVSAGTSSRSATAAAAPSPGEPSFGLPPALLIPDLGNDQPSAHLPLAIQLAGSPVYLTFDDGDVWRFDGWLRNVAPTSLVKVGEMDARLGAGTKQHRGIYEPIGRSDIRYVHWDDNDYQIYVPTVARMGDRVYVLTSSEPIGEWGRWPTWPASVMPYPLSPSSFAGKLALPGQGMVYFAPTVRPIRGLAVPPREKAGAVKIPKWTWWRARRTAQ